MDSYELLQKNKFPPGRQGSENEVSKLGKTHFVKNKCSLSHPGSLHVSVNTGVGSFEAHTQIAPFACELGFQVELIASQLHASGPL